MGGLGWSGGGQSSIMVGGCIHIVFGMIFVDGMDTLGSSSSSSPWHWPLVLRRHCASMLSSSLFFFVAFVFIVLACCHHHCFSLSPSSSLCWHGRPVDDNIIVVFAVLLAISVALTSCWYAVVVVVFVTSIVFIFIAPELAPCRR